MNERQRAKAKIVQRIKRFDTSNSVYDANFHREGELKELVGGDLKRINHSTDLSGTCAVYIFLSI